MESSVYLLLEFFPQGSWALSFKLYEINVKPPFTWLQRGEGGLHLGGDRGRSCSNGPLQGALPSAFLPHGLVLVGGLWRALECVPSFSVACLQQLGTTLEFSCPRQLSTLGKLNFTPSISSFLPRRFRSDHGVCWCQPRF